MDEPLDTQEEPQGEEPQAEEPQGEESQAEEPQAYEEEELPSAPEPKKRGRPRMTPEQKKEAKAARNRLKVVEAKPPPVKKEPAKIIERVVREYVEVPVLPVQTSPFEAIGNVLRNRAISDYERKKQQWATFQLI
jgi:hypothetical protein